MKVYAWAVAGAAALFSVAAQANADAIVGQWQTYEDNQPKAVVRISQANGVYTGVIVSGNTEKAKQYVGRTVITGLTANGDGKYSGGRIFDPVSGKNYRLRATLNGDTLSLRGSIGPIGRTQVWKRVR